LHVTIRDLKEEVSTLSAKEQEAATKRRDLEKKIEAAELEAASARNEAKLSAQRVQDLQAALTAEINSETEDTRYDINF